MQVIGAEWKALSDEEKQQYVDMADEDKTRASDAKEAYAAKRKEEGIESSDEEPAKAKKGKKAKKKKVAEGMGYSA